MAVFSHKRASCTKYLNYCSANANNYNNNNKKNNCYTNNNNNNVKAHYRNSKNQLIFVFWTLLLSLDALTIVQGAAIYSNNLEPNFEPLCSNQEEHFIESDGKESSLILEFNGADEQQTSSCTRILSAPSNYGFIVRMILPKIRHRTALQTSAFSSAIPTLVAASTPSTVEKIAGNYTNTTATELSEISSLLSSLNTTALKNVLARTCPLSIFSAQDPHAPLWRMDPCLLEDTAPEMEDPVRLFHGRIRIVWEHGHTLLNSKLMVTALGKGQQCHAENKHQCLKIGDEPILCISQDLVCDGIRHCPYSNEYDSDEDYAMCWKRRRFGEPIPPTMETDIFEHFALEVFRNLFAFDVTRSNKTINGTLTNSSAAKTNTTAATDDPIPENTTEHTFGHHHRRNLTRFGVNSDLSKYGPWGYLMLGMLLCGGALLICGLWASATQHATNNEREAALQSAQYANGMEQQSSTTSPPNYDELDPPPPYAVLFPHQKTNSSATLNSLGASSTVPSLMPAVMAASSRVALSAAIPPTATLTAEQDVDNSSNDNGSSTAAVTTANGSN